MATTKKAAKKSVGGAPAKKAARKVGARKGVKKVVAKEARARKVAKKATAKKVVARKVVRKAAAKKVVARKAARTVAGKTTARKAAKGTAGEAPRKTVAQAGTSRRQPRKATKRVSHLTPEQALANTRALLAAKQAHDRETPPWQLIGSHGEGGAAHDGFQSDAARDRAADLHEGEMHLHAIQGSVSSSGRRKQGRRDSREGT